MPDNYLGRILTARVYDVAIETPLDPAKNLSRRLGCGVSLKREDLQEIFSFKVRGAYNKMAQLSSTQLRNGVVAASAGNHAQGVALAAQKLGCSATIVMPVTTPAIKVEAVQARGAETVLTGDNYDAAAEHALALSRKHKRPYIPPYDDPAVIAGQGTVGQEILKQQQGPLHAIFVPVGGGGLISGIAAYVKQVRPDIKVIGVEPADAPSMHASLAADRRVKLKHVGIFADGAAVKQVGKETFKLARRWVDEVILADTDEICAAIKDVFEDTRTIMEPAGALAVAGMKKYVKQNKIKGKTLVAITSGANINFDRLRHVSERAEIGERREAILAVTIPEQPGSFQQFCQTLGERSITEFNYRYADTGRAHIFVGVQINSGEEIKPLIKVLKRQGYETVDLTDNEIAKLHVRHMVGGRAPQVSDERIFRFEFPERPRALGDFLDTMGGKWNISMFHYRNHGADFGRVLCGIQVPAKDNRQFARFLKVLGYDYSEESDNPAYQLFLS